MTIDMAPWLRSWDLSLRSSSKSDETRKTYGTAVRLLGDFLTARGHGEFPEVDFEELTDLTDITSQHIQAFVVYEIQRTSDSSANNRFRGCQQFFNWLVAEEEIASSPMKGLSPPKPGEKEVPVIPPDALKKLLKSLEGKGFAEVRDRAIILLFLDSGLRLSELGNLKVDNINFDYQVAGVLGKGNKERSVPFGTKAATALDRYLRVRARHAPAGVEDLWLGQLLRTRLTASGIAKMLERRSAAVGITHINPHRFRHTFSHMWLDAGGNETDLMRINGWKSRSMVERYGASAASARARRQHRTLSPGDNL